MAEVFLKAVNCVGNPPWQIGGTVFSGKAQAFPEAQAIKIRKFNPGIVVVCDKDGKPLEDVPVAKPPERPSNPEARVDVPPPAVVEETEIVEPEEGMESGDTLPSDDELRANEPSQQKSTLD